MLSVYDDNNVFCVIKNSRAEVNWRSTWLMSTLCDFESNSEFTSSSIGTLISSSGLSWPCWLFLSSISVTFWKFSVSSKIWSWKVLAIASSSRISFTSFMYYNFLTFYWCLTRNFFIPRECSLTKKVFYKLKSSLYTQLTANLKFYITPFHDK